MGRPRFNFRQIVIFLNSLPPEPNEEILYVFVACLLLISCTLFNGQDLKVGAAVRIITLNPLLSKQPFLFGLTNDAFGYMLTKVDFNSFKRYDYVSPTSLGEMTGEIYMDQALKLVQTSPKPDQQK